MPPGTGDVPLTLGQLVHVHGSSHIFHLMTVLTYLQTSAGSVIVSTPQSVALDDVRKGLSTFSKLSIPVCPPLSLFPCSSFFLISHVAHWPLTEHGTHLLPVMCNPAPDLRLARRLHRARGAKRSPRAGRSPSRPRSRRCERCGSAICALETGRGPDLWRGREEGRRRVGRRHGPRCGERVGELGRHRKHVNVTRVVAGSLRKHRRISAI
jgi:hypothetical protein